MKKINPALALACMALLAQAPLRADQPIPTGYATSPDHPSTWVVGADNVHQALRWDPEKHRLFVDVKYSTVLYADDTHPTQESDYSLAFPMVHLDPATGVFTVHGVKVGTLRRGFFGNRVVLDRGVELDVHRHHGRIFATIAPGGTD